MLAVVAGLGAASLIGGYEATGSAPGSPPSALARREIPAQYLRLYEQAAARYQLDWAVLAAIGRVECDHGRDADPSCWREGAVNAAGAGGPMQFLASTWARYGVDGDGDGRADRWNVADAIFSAANYLAHSGAPSDYERAILAYNHASWYVSEVEAWAVRYRGAPAAGTARAVLPGGVESLGSRSAPHGCRRRPRHPFASSPETARRWRRATVTSRCCRRARRSWSTPC